MRNHKRAWKNRRTHRRIQRYNKIRNVNLLANNLKDEAMWTIYRPNRMCGGYLFGLYVYDPVTIWDLAAL